jgi:hypothetical protein
VARVGSDDVAVPNLAVAPARMAVS